MRYELIRILRKEKGLTLVELGEKTGYTPSFLSQLERGLKQPSLDTLRKITECLGVSLLTLLDHEASGAGDAAQSRDCVVIRRDGRQKFTLEGVKTEYEMLTPQSDEKLRQFQLRGTLVKVAPGAWTNERPLVHFYEEFSYVLSGTMTAVIGESSYQLETGDSITVFGFAPHNYLNTGDEPLVVLAFHAY